MDEILAKPEGPENTEVKEGEITPTKVKILRFMERGVYLTAIFGLILVLGLGYSEHKTRIQEADQLIEDTTKRKIEATTKVAELTEENKILNEKLVNLKNKEDLARRDLELYILKKYRVVPKVVAREVAAQVVRLTKEEGVPFSLIVGLIEVESQFKPWAVSKKDARGLMQVMPFWVNNKKANLGLKSKYDLHDVETNIKAGIAVFKVHLGEANNDINQGLYLYVGKDNTYANKVFNAMGKFEVFRSTLDTTFRDEESGENGEDTKEAGKTPKKGA